jgi:hypothetical protein
MAKRCPRLSGLIAHYQILVDEADRLVLIDGNKEKGINGKILRVRGSSETRWFSQLRTSLLLFC